MSLNYLGSLIGTEVKINRGGPDSIVGRLLSVHHDYLAIQTKDGTIVYIQLQHIKSISSTNSNASRGNKSNRSNTSHRSHRSHHRFTFAHTFEGLLGQMRYTFVQINRGGPEKVEGLVVHSGDNVLLLVVNNEIIRIPIFHIKSINAVNKNNSKGNNSNSSSNKNNNNNKSNNNKSNKATASQIVAIKLLLKKYRAL
ncbi:hypothetical protein HQN89_18670 [Paenibacillus frigoriresistens]|uniref:hypothetical protein n=1 Tax=Paenibacillus alginolyticus TaxID=59839 RepID=UPI00156675A3|nr:hypothetical protein [Paenibacillus frigoriresistens]NRF93003.1 hypothetical protein [Paenibacillus frigoriresistens]